MASGVNPLDLKISAGQAAHAQTRLPAILGVDMAGIVVEVGEGVADLLAIKTANWSMREAAAIPLSFITAWEGLADRARV